MFSELILVSETRKEQTRYIPKLEYTRVADVVIDTRVYDGLILDELGSIMLFGAIVGVFDDPNPVKDVCILEEPEHLICHHANRVWTEVFTFQFGLSTQTVLNMQVVTDLLDLTARRH